MAADPPPELDEVLFTRDQVAQRVRDLGAEISRDYGGRELHLIGVLRGAVIFLADLAREISVPTSMDFIAVSSYGASSQSSGVVRIVKDVEEELAGRHVLLVEDVVDTGLTLNYLTEMLRGRGPASLEVCALLDKPDQRRVPCSVRYVGFRVPPRFLVGYGLDYAQRYRGLPYVAALRDVPKK